RGREPGMPSGHAGIAAYRPVANDRSCVKTLKLGFLVQCRGSPTPNEDIAALQQQLKGARTRIHNLTVEKNAAWRARTRPAMQTPLPSPRPTCASCKKFSIQTRSTTLPQPRAKRS